jgi:hypothetical protein
MGSMVVSGLCDGLQDTEATQFPNHSQQLSSTSKTDLLVLRVMESLLENSCQGFRVGASIPSALRQSKGTVTICILAPQVEGQKALLIGQD